MHISSSGQAGNTGSASSPVSSFRSARDTIRAIRENDKEKRKEHFTVIVHPGTYQFTENLELGAEEYNTTWKSAQPNSVFITGGIDIETQGVSALSDSEKARILTPEARGKILKIDLTKAGVRGDLGALQQRGVARPYRPMQSELSIDGKAQTLARWPNAGDKNVRIAKVIDKGLSLLEMERKPQRAVIMSFTHRSKLAHQQTRPRKHQWTSLRRHLIPAQGRPQKCRHQ